MTDIISLKDSLTTKVGIIIFDVTWAFKGDHPATQYEAGQQKGGNYACHAVTLIQTAIKNTVMLPNANTCHSKIESQRFCIFFHPESN